MTRTWHKIDSLGWLDGSIRTDLTIEERSIWADFIALCSVSRIEGIICRGENRPYDYPSLANRLNISLDSLTTAIAKFKQEKMIATDGTGIRLTKWAKYNPPIGIKRKAYQSKHQEEEHEDLTPEQLETLADADCQELDRQLAISQEAADAYSYKIGDERLARAENWKAQHATKES